MDQSIFSDEFLMALVRHQTYLLRYSGTVRNRIQEILSATDEELGTRIRDALRNSQGLVSPSDISRMETLQEKIAAVRSAAWDEANGYFKDQMSALPAVELNTTAAIATTLSPVFIEFSLPPMSLVRAIAMDRPFQGRTLKEWASALEEDDLRRINTAIQVGMLNGETGEAVARRVVGTGALNNADGVLNTTMRNVQAITRTAIMHISNASRTELFRANAGIIVGEVFIATLDGRTTAVCKANDHKQFDVGMGPQPPLHIACRSLRVAALNVAMLGNRPMKPVTEQMLVREYARDNDLGPLQDRDALPYGTKGAFDDWARGRVRELIGQVPATTSYQKFLEAQSREFQDDTLGKTKAALFRAGMPLDKFVTREGSELTLDQIARKHAAYFRAAGLDPAAFQ